MKKHLLFGIAFLTFGSVVVPAQAPINLLPPVVSITRPENNDIFHPGDEVTVRASVDDGDGPGPNSVTYSYRSGNSATWTEMDPVTNAPNYQLVISLPNNMPIGNATLRAVASDGELTSLLPAEITLRIQAPNVAPTISANPPVTGTITGTVDEPISPITVTASGTPAPDLTVTIVPANSGLTFTAGKLQGTPDITGTITATFTADNGVNPDDEQIIRFSIDPANQPPVASAGANVEITLPTNTVVLNGSATDDAGTTGLKYLWTTSPGSGVSFSPNGNTAKPTATFSGGAGSYTLTLKVTDEGLLTDIDEMVVTVNPVPDVPPAFTNPTGNTLSGTENVLFPTLSITTSGTPAAKVTLSKGALPQGLTFTSGAGSNLGKGSIQGTPTVSGVFVFTLTAENAAGVENLEITLTVAVGNQAPVVNAGANVQITLPTNSVLLNGSATDDGGAGNLAYLWSASPASGVTFTSTTVLKPTVTLPGSGVYTLTLRATDEGNPVRFSTDAMTITVSDVPDVAPAITINPATNPIAGNVNVAITPITVTASGSPAPTVTVAFSPANSGLAFTAGKIQGTPTVSGTITATVTADNNVEPNAVLPIVFNIAGTAPAITITPATNPIPGNVNVAITPITVTASGIPTPTVAVAFSPANSGLAFTAGKIQGTPTVSGTITATVTADNNVEPNAVLPIVFNIAGTAPAITINPATNPISGNVNVAITPITVTASGIPTPTVTVAFSPANSGLAFTAGKIQGTPAVSGTITATVTADNNVEPNAVLPIVFNIAGTAPAITTNPATNPISGNVNDPIQTISVTTSGIPTPDLSATILPANSGLVFTPGVKGAGTITGTPRSAVAMTVTLTATNGAGTGATKEMKFNIGSALSAPGISIAPTSISGNINSTFNLAFTTSGNPPPGVTASALPAGLTLGANAITGKPTALGTLSVVLTASNDEGNAKDTVSITINPALAPPTLSVQASATGTIGVALNIPITLGGFPVPTVTATGLPTGAGINAGGTAITGAPGRTGPFTVVLTATNSGGSAKDTLNLTVNEAPAKPVITNPTTTPYTTPATAKSFFTYTVTAAGNPKPTLAASGLQTWLGFNAATGVLSGTPTAKGDVSITLTANNTEGTDTKILKIAVGDSTVKPTVLNASLPAGKVDAFYSVVLTAAGTSPITFTATGLPTGLAVTGNKIEGTPKQEGSFSAKITANNAFGDSPVKTLSLTINSDPKITKNLEAAMTVNDKATATFSVTATAYPSVTYQWQYRLGTTGGFNTVGTNSNTYTINPVSAASAGYYKVIVKNASTGTEVTSTTCQLTVKPLPIPVKITSQPLAVSVVVGGQIRLTGRATGEPPLEYQWFKGNAQVSARTRAESTFVIQSAAVSDAGDYKLYVRNVDNTDNYAYSDFAKVTVSEPKLVKPKSTPGSGSFYPSAKVILYNDTPGTDIYYTLNGVDPVQSITAANFKFNSGDTLRLDTTRTVKARSYKAGYQASDVLSATFTYTDPGQVVKPTIKPTTPTFKNSLVVTLSDTTAGAEILYTTDGTSPLTGNPSKFIAPFTINATTTIIAVARKTGMRDSDTLKMTYTLEVNPSKVLTPTIKPPGGNYTAPLAITLASPADTLAALWYTVDGSAPDTSSSRIKYDGKPFSLKNSAQVRVVAMRSGWLTSDIASESYQLNAGTLEASPSPRVFDSAITVFLTARPDTTAVIRFAVDGTPDSLSPIFPSKGYELLGTATIYAFAKVNGVASKVYSFGYTLDKGQLALPVTETGGSQTIFKDTLRVTLRSPVEGSNIYYTTDGSLPGPGSIRYTAPILIDTTTTFNVRSSKTGFLDSKILEATYTLVPEMPIASPAGGAYYADNLFIKLSCSSRRASIFYTLTKPQSSPGPQIAYVRGDSIPLTDNTVLKAYAAAGNRSSDVMEESYDFIIMPETQLKPGVSVPIPGNYSLRIPENEDAGVVLRLSNTNTMFMSGFEGVQYAMTLSLLANPLNPAAEFPRVTFASPTSDKRSLYKYELSGDVNFVSSADTVTLTQAGTYFMGIDSAPPVIAYIGEGFEALDSTRVTFRISDNISNLSYSLKRNDNAARNENQKFVFSGSELSFKLHHKSGTLKPLSLQLIVNDYKAAAFFPPSAGAMLSLSQRMGAISSPEVWGIGTSKTPFDLISIPLDLVTPMTLNRLRAANPKALIESVAWSNIDSLYHKQDSNFVFLPGKGYWVGSNSRISSCSLLSAVTKPTLTSATKPAEVGIFTIPLRRGWNQIGNPHLEKLYWPISRNQAGYGLSFVKGLWDYSPSSGNYEESDSLLPWRGYYVYQFGTDTVITLLRAPLSSSSAKVSATGNGISLSLGWGKASVLRLGANGNTSDSLGVEDEFSLPQMNRGLYMRALRQGRTLASDWIRLDPGKVQEWKLALGGTGDSLPPLKILSQTLPKDYETWAVSPSRGMKFLVEPEKEIAASGLAQDTLLIYSGTRALLARMGILQRMAVAAAPLDLKVSARDGGFRMQMSLPSKARVHAVVWGLDGTRKGELILGPLSEGFYRFAWHSDFRNGSRRLTPGMYVLTLEVRGAGLNTRLSRKIALSN